MYLHIPSFSYAKNTRLRLSAFPLFCFFPLNRLEFQDFFVPLPTVRGEIRTKQSIRYYFAFSQKPRKLIGNKNAQR